MFVPSLTVNMWALTRMRARTGIIGLYTSFRSSVVYPPTSHQTIRIVRSGIFSAITVPAVQSRDTSGAMPSFIVYFSSLCFLILVMFVRLVTMGVDYSKKDVKVIKSVDKAHPKGKR